MAVIPAIEHAKHVQQHRADRSRRCAGRAKPRDRIESSAVVDALIDDPANPELIALIADSDLHAPSLLDYEVANALRGHALGGKLADARLDDASEDFTALHIERYPLSTMMRDVFELRDNFTVYDAAYVVLARALELPLVTADAKLTESRRLGVNVRILRPPP